MKAGGRQWTKRTTADCGEKISIMVMEILNISIMVMEILNISIMMMEMFRALFNFK
jgi:hypothetical protein